MRRGARRDHRLCVGGCRLRLHPFLDAQVALDLQLAQLADERRRLSGELFVLALERA